MKCEMARVWVWKFTDFGVFSPNHSLLLLVAECNPEKAECVVSCHGFTNTYLYVSDIRLQYESTVIATTI